MLVRVWWMVIGCVDYRNRTVFQDPEDLKDCIQCALCNLASGILPNGFRAWCPVLVVKGICGYKFGSWFGGKLFF